MLYTMVDYNSPKLPIKRPF